MASGRLNQLSDSCLRSTTDASQIPDGPFNFLRWIGFLLYLFAILMWKHVCTCVRLSTHLVATPFVAHTRAWNKRVSSILKEPG